MNRRQVLSTGGMVLGGSLIGCKTLATTENPKSYTFDMHTHPGAFFRKGSPEYAGDEAFINRINDMNAAGLNGAFISVVSDLSLLKVTKEGIKVSGTYAKGEGWLAYQSQLKIIKDLIAKSNALMAIKADDIQNQSHVAAYLSCEGGDFLDNDIHNLQKAYTDGVRSVQLVHYAPNTLGDLQTWKAEHGGLSPFGKEVVQKMNELGMVIDVAHASSRTVKNVVDITDDPIILSHSILKNDTASPISARAISHGHARLVSETGGVIGMWPSGYSKDMAEFVDATFRMVDAVGIDHVGLGSDMDGNYKPIISNYGEYIDWREALVTRGMTKTELDKVSGGNMVRVMESVIQ